MNVINYSKKLIVIPSPLDLFHAIAEATGNYPAELQSARRAKFLCQAARMRDAADPAEAVDLLSDKDALTEAQRQLREIARGPFWLDDTCGDVSEPAQSSTATAAAYGDLDIAEWNAQHRDWLDEKRTQEDAR